MDLDMASLKEMGVSKVGERVKLLSGIKDLRKRATGNSGLGIGMGMGRSSVELRLNGTATPSPDWTNVNGIGMNGNAGASAGSNGTNGGSGLGGAVVRGNHERSLSHAGSQSSMGDRRGMIDRSLSARRAGTSRPPPLDLQTNRRGHAPSASYSRVNGDQPASAVSAASIYDAPVSAATLRTDVSSAATTPRPAAHSGPNINPTYPGSLQRPSISSQSSSSATITPSTLHTSSSSRTHTLPTNLNLRAPPPRDGGRRSPSPIVNNDPANFMDRPLPPPPGSSGSSAAEYARRHAGTPTPSSTWDSSHSKGPSPMLSHGRAATSHGLPSSRDRKIPSSLTPSKQSSPVKPKFSGMTSAARPQPAVHPFAATRDPKEMSPPKEREQSSRGENGHHSGSLRNQTGGYTIGAGPLKSNNVPGPNKRQNSASSMTTSSSTAHMSLEDLRRQLVKFINSEDGTTRTVNVSSCASGVEVLERVLRKFGKWNTGNVSTDGESEEEGERLEVDGWGVYTDDADLNCEHYFSFMKRNKR